MVPIQSIRSIRADERGVSPVIGVILMVAITVILAAVIGTFVLGLGENVQNEAPQASFAFSDHSNDYESGVSSQDAFNIQHNGGEDVAGEGLIINIRKDSNNALVAKWEDGTWDTDVSSTVNGGAMGGTTLLTTGDQITITDDMGGVLSDETRYSISLIDKESGQKIGTATLTLR